jgi:Zn-dependent protease with chaperone function
VALLKGLRVLDLKAVLAHEFGHLRNEDAAGGSFALAVRRSLLTLAASLARSGAARWYNPTWIFVNVFLRVFMVVSQGAFRLQEVLADRWAIRAYGSEAFERGLRHVVSRAIRHDAHVELSVRESLADKRPIVNVYTHVPQGGAPNVEGLIEDATYRPPSVYDSHPTPAERIAWATLLATPAPSRGPDDDAPAWSLFSAREKLERQMTDRLRITMLAQGIVMPRPTAADRVAAEA